MIIDTSAIVALLVKEPGFEELLDQLADDPNPAVNAATLTETAIVMSARIGEDARGMLARFIQEGGIEVLPFGDAHYSAAVDAWSRYGKGRHPASLNFGDCLTYAAATLSGEPLLSVGSDFAQTDLELA
jgi:ribonuclease VapC